MLSRLAVVNSDRKKCIRSLKPSLLPVSGSNSQTNTTPASNTTRLLQLHVPLGVSNHLLQSFPPTTKTTNTETRSLKRHFWLVGTSLNHEGFTIASSDSGLPVPFFPYIPQNRRPAPPKTPSPTNCSTADATLPLIQGQANQQSGAHGQTPAGALGTGVCTSIPPAISAVASDIAIAPDWLVGANEIVASLH